MRNCFAGDEFLSSTESKRIEIVDRIGAKNESIPKAEVRFAGLLPFKDEDSMQRSYLVCVLNRLKRSDNTRLYSIVRNVRMNEIWMIDLYGDNPNCGDRKPKSVT